MSKLGTFVKGVAFGAGTIALLGAIVEAMNMHTTGYGKVIYNDGRVDDIPSFKGYMNHRFEEVKYSANKVKDDVEVASKKLYDDVDTKIYAMQNMNCKEEIKKVVDKANEALRKSADVAKEDLNKIFDNSMEKLDKFFEADREYDGVFDDDIDSLDKFFEDKDEETGVDTADEADDELKELDDIYNDRDGDL